MFRWFILRQQQLEEARMRRKGADSLGCDAGFPVRPRSLGFILRSLGLSTLGETLSIHVEKVTVPNAGDLAQSMVRKEHTI